MKQIVLRFGLLAAALFLLLQIGEYTLFTQRLGRELWVLIFASLFLGFGWVLSRQLGKKKVQEANQEPTNNYEIDQAKIKTLGISEREYEVLQLIARGLSNQEIASQLFISESTVKTHVSNLLSKLDARRRTQAVSNARKQRLI